MNEFNEYNFLCHHGILGMKWGVRRYQNPDGSLTAAGRARYGRKDSFPGESKIARMYEDHTLYKKLTSGPKMERLTKEYYKKYNEYAKQYGTDPGEMDGSEAFDKVWDRGGNISKIWYDYQDKRDRQFLKDNNIPITNESLATMRRYEAKLGDFNSLFISGSAKTQDSSSTFYKKELPQSVKDVIDNHKRENYFTQFIVGDAPGIDSQVQDYLKEQKMSDVIVYYSGDKPRNLSDPRWVTVKVDAGKTKPGTPEYNRQKDIAMTYASDSAITVVLENGGAGATRNNAKRMIEQNKDVKMIKLNSDGTDELIDDLLKELRE